MAPPCLLRDAPQKAYRKVRDPGKFLIPCDFPGMDRSFLRTGRALIYVYGEEITLRVNDEAVTFNLNQTMRYSSTYDDLSVNRIDIIDVAKEDPWVSPIHCVPKKGGITVVENENNVLNPTWLVTGWRVCIDYRKLNNATRKDHFPLPFMDQMLERLSGNEFYCFLVGFSQIPINPPDQEKTTFTCPYGTFAYRRMTFGLCNAPGTFQRCIMAIFHDMIEKSMEVFMNDFSVFGDSFSSCLSYLDTMLQRCGEPLNGFSPCQWCTCELCGNDLRDGFCSLCDSRNSCVYDPNLNSFDSPYDSYHPSHLIYETYSCESCGNDSHFGYDCSPQFPLNCESKPSYIQNYNSYPYDSPSFPQQYFCCENCGGPHENFHCQLMNQNFYEPNLCYNSISSDFDQFQPPQFLVIHQPPQKMSIQDMEDLKQQYLDEMKSLINSKHRDEIKIDELKANFNRISIKINKKEKLQQLEQVANLSTYPSQRFDSFCYDDDDDEDYTVAITPDFLITDSLIMENEHLDTILKTKSDELIKSSVENLVQNPSESEDECECDVPDCDDSQTTDFSTFSNSLFDDSTSSDDKSSHEEVIDEMSFKTYLNPLYDLDEEIISSEFNPIHNEDFDSTPRNDRFDTTSYLLESLLNRDTLMDSSTNFDSLLDKFSGELAHTDLIPLGINEANCDPEEDMHLVERLL
uniref:Reverse transcriptase domain-containing protein n=1 Tax=Tanacetum cinerariifolium TaxID=118510 RepID=A0A6L2MAQ6_TANCI|nr:reverse transcriptase domain-containing protein [Tanacetum cinerariifolium]